MAKATIPAMDSPENTGLIVPIDVEALCIGKDPGPIFEQNPYDFSQLLKGGAPYVSSAIKSGGLTSMQPGVHLHWALPDALTKGAENQGAVQFPSVPDRWLVTRIFCDPDQAVKPQFDQWVIEGNYFSSDNPDSARDLVAIPFQGDNWEQQAWRYLGRVSTLDDWVKSAGQLRDSSDDSYLSGLTAIGYGQHDFAASYQNCKNIFGFNDLGADLEKLGTSSHDKMLSYHIVGWYSDPSQDPINQLPALVPASDFNDLLGKITNAADKAFVSSSFQVSTYLLKADVPGDAGQRLWQILEMAGYPLEIEIPGQISPDQFAKVLANISDNADKAFLQSWYLPDMSPVSGLSAQDTLKLRNIMATAGFDFLGALLSRAKWSLPSGTETSPVSPAYTLYTGLITNIAWNESTDYFQDNPGDNFNIAIGNTPGQALSALLANTSGFTPDQASQVEEILDALQQGLLDQVKDDSMLADWEALKAALHTGSFSSTRGGYLWEVRPAKSSGQSSQEVTLSETLAKDLNNLNIAQQQLNMLEEQITSIRKHVFSDWYRFMLVLYNGGEDPSGGIQPGDLAPYIVQKITGMNDLISQANQLVDELNKQEANLRNELGRDYLLSQITAPRYWQPNDPVLLFQGDGIQPSDRFGNDGRYMYDDTLVCRLNVQLQSSLKIPAGTFGKNTAVTLDSSTVSPIPNPNNLPVIDLVNQTMVDAALLNDDLIAAQLRLAGSATELKDLVTAIKPLITGFLAPPVEKTVSEAVYQQILAVIAAEDQDFLNKLYTLQGTDYVLNNDPADLSANDTLRLQYIQISAAINPSQDKLSYSGLAFSQVGIQDWDGNPWLPYSLKWSVYFYPLQEISPGAQGYPSDFITSQFNIGDTNLDYAGPSLSPAQAGIAVYSNAISLTPHAGINLQAQLGKFIDQHPDDPMKEELSGILTHLGNKPVLSQALSGFNEALLMLHKQMQLPVADPYPSISYYNFTNTTVHDAVEDQNSEMPAPGNSYNPIRVGLMKIADVTLVDVFGRNVTISSPPLVIRAQNMIQSLLTPAINIYLPPRLTQPSRLLFRWISADDDTVEMNSHPATTPVCGWVLTNHLDDSLWIYDNNGNPYGSMILNWDESAIVWQTTPGSPYFGLSVQDFFAQIDANTHLKDFVLGLYGDGGQASATYLQDFMRALDEASYTIEPGSGQQYQSNAVLMGRPYALVRASLDLQLMGEPDYSQSWPDLKNEVEQFTNGQFIPGNDHGLTNVNFPVKIGNIHQTEDGLAGYFKDGNYDIFYSPAVTEPTSKVLPPADDTLVVAAAAQAKSTLITMLIDPRAKVHATTGILPVKAIEVPPDQYLDALQKLQLCFLTTPVLTPTSQLSMPLPALSGGEWSWVENDGAAWSEKQKIGTVTTEAVMNYTSQQMLEGWLRLSSMLLTANNFSLVNTKAGKAVLYITDDPALNALVLTLANPGALPLYLKGGAPVRNSYAQGGSSIVFNCGHMISDQTLSTLQVSAQGWGSQYYPAANDQPAVWAIAPTQDIHLPAKTSVAIAINGITCPAGTLPGNFQVTYFGLPDIPNSLAPVLIPVDVQNPPTQS